MPALNIFNKDIVLPNYEYSDKYWPILSKIVYDEIGNKENKDPDIVQQLLKKCFVNLCSILDLKISEQKKASFYIFCQKIHEDSIEVWSRNNKENSLGEIEEDFAASRRVLKIILEQSCKLDLIGAANFYEEIEANLNEYTEYLEELLYIGTWCYTLSEFISRSQLFSSSIGLIIKDHELNILTYQPFPALFEFLFYEIQKHNSEQVVSDSIIGFKELLLNEFEVDYNILSSFINEQLVDPKFRFGLLKINELIDDIHKRYDYNKEFTTDFYKGLTIDKNNSLNVENCFLQNQHENRHVFRPILQLNIDNVNYHMIGYNKWVESLTLLTTNSFPFGLFPLEWKQYQSIRDFVNLIDNTHDKLLENPIIKLLEENKRKFDFNIESFEQLKGNNINIKDTVGDIDILFLDEKYKMLYVCECKHNRSRYDLNNWKRDYSNFRNKYESQLKRKVDWVNQNISIVENHLKKKYQEKFDINLENFEVMGIFIINAPTVYMFNGNYRAFTISDIRELLAEQYVDIKFEFVNESSGKKLFIEHPYFDNLEKKLKE